MVPMPRRWRKCETLAVAGRDGQSAGQAAVMQTLDWTPPCPTLPCPGPPLSWALWAVGDKLLPIRPWGVAFLMLAIMNRTAIGRSHSLKMCGIVLHLFGEFAVFWECFSTCLEGNFFVTCYHVAKESAIHTFNKPPSEKLIHNYFPLLFAVWMPPPVKISIILHTLWMHVFKPHFLRQVAVASL